MIDDGNILMSLYSLIWEKIVETAKKIGRAVARSLILLYYVMRSDKTPKSDKTLILSALAYLVLPVDLIPAGRFPVFGWLDEAASLAIALRKTRKYITPQMEADADALLDKWFPQYTRYELVGD